MNPLDPNMQLGKAIKSARFGVIRLEKIIGEGSFAVVFRGTHLMTRKPYAIKCLYKSGLTEQQMAVQFAEAGLHKRVSKVPHVAPLLYVVEDKDHVYMIMDYYETDLLSYINSKRNISERDAKRMFLQIAAAVAGCHQLGVYHRDLKPENILVSNGNAYLCDFGLSTTKNMSKDFGCGSACYMPPECRIGSKTAYFPQSNDVWALGIIFINIFTAKCPWHKASIEDRNYFKHIVKTSFMDSFQTQFGFSAKTCALLRRTFDLDPLKRPNALAIYQQISTSYDFFASDSAISLSFKNEHFSFVEEHTKPHTELPKTNQLENTGLSLLENTALSFLANTGLPSPVSKLECRNSSNDSSLRGSIDFQLLEHYKVNEDLLFQLEM